MEIVLIGAGLYVCGRGTEEYGTILPAIFEWARNKKTIVKAHCCSTSAESSRGLAAKAKRLEIKTGVKLDVHSYPDKGSKVDDAYKDALANCGKPACAVVAVPDHLHNTIAKDCLNAGLHTLLVKPLTPTRAEGEELVKLAKANNLYGFVEFHKRWDKSNILLRDMFVTGKLGGPLNCWIEYSQRRSIPLSFFKAWAAQTSILQYLGVHYIDAVRFITAANPRRVMAAGQKTSLIKHGLDTYDAIQCMVEWEMPDGTSFTETILTNWIDPETSSAMSDQKIKFVGTKGRYEADQKDRGIIVNTDVSGVQHVNPDFCMAYGTNDGHMHWRGYGIDCTNTFLSDVLALENGLISLADLERQRPTFKESLLSTVVIEAAHKSLGEESVWVPIKN